MENRRKTNLITLKNGGKLNQRWNSLTIALLFEISQLKAENLINLEIFTSGMVLDWMLDKKINGGNLAECIDKLPKELVFSKKQGLELPLPLVRIFYKEGRRGIDPITNKPNRIWKKKTNATLDHFLAGDLTKKN